MLDKGPVAGMAIRFAARARTGSRRAGRRPRTASGVRPGYEARSALRRYGVDELRVAHEILDQRVGRLCVVDRDRQREMIDVVPVLVVEEVGDQRHLLAVLPLEVGDVPEAVEGGRAGGVVDQGA